MTSEGLDAEMTALVLRDIAAHLSRGEAYMHNGAWSAEFVEPAAPRSRSARRHYDLGRRQATADAVYALLSIANLNAPAAVGEDV